MKIKALCWRYKGMIRQVGFEVLLETSYWVNTENARPLTLWRGCADEWGLNEMLGTAQGQGKTGCPLKALKWSLRALLPTHWDGSVSWFLTCLLKKIKEQVGKSGQRELCVGNTKVSLEEVRTWKTRCCVVQHIQKWHQLWFWGF